MKLTKLIVGGALAVLAVIVIAGLFVWMASGVSSDQEAGPVEQAIGQIKAASVSASPLICGKDVFCVPKVIEEASSMAASSSPDWWLSSGGRVMGAGTVFSTLRGELDGSDYWRKLYVRSNPKDTDQGYRPQNVFRLVHRHKYQNYTQQVYFKVLANNFSDSVYRNETNGVHFFNRYKDANNLYYTGVRVDGTVAVKKKVNGRYYTMIEKQIFPGVYSRAAKNNLLPVNKWIGVKTKVEDTGKGEVSIKVYLDKEQTGEWVLVAAVKDSDGSYGGKIFADPGYTGVRSDFMDIEFKDYAVKKL